MLVGQKPRARNLERAETTSWERTPRNLSHLSSKFRCL
jgi:hypothetical protein